jgi:CheY-like chemotaxis protein
VRDTGKGIEDKDYSKIFEKFYQCGKKDVDNPPGVGLGLAITRELVELLGGSINLVSSTSGTGRGTVFYVSLPCGRKIDSQNNKTHEHKQKSAPEYHDEYTVLVVEDNVVNQTLMKRILNKFGLSCLIAESALKAIEVLKGNTKIDLVFMDLYLPDLNGFEALKLINRMKIEGSLPGQIPVIALTAASMTEDREKCIRQGFDDYLAKPVNIDLLQGILYKYLMGN